MLQLDPAVIKKMISKSQSKKECCFLWATMLLRSILLVSFAIVFIAPLSSIFGAENNAMAVSMFCILLAIRFVDFGYCIKDSLLNLAIIFLLLLVSPVLGYYTNPILAFLIHFLSFFIILFMSCDKPEMGNGGLYSFAYIFLSGNPVEGVIFYKRFLLTCLCFLICASVFYFKHKDKYTEIPFLMKRKQFNLYAHKHQWQIRMSLGVSLILTLGVFFHIKRYMWMAFACGSLLSDHSREPNIKQRFIHRLAGAVAGSAIFYLLCRFLPTSFQSVLGILGGIVLGLCTEYAYKSALNCFGAIVTAASLYGLNEAVILRIVNTFAGVVFAFVFFFLYEYLIGKRLKEKYAAET